MKSRFFSSRIDENNKIIEKISNEFSGDYLFVKKEIEKMGRVEILYFAIDETLIKVNDFKDALEKEDIDKMKQKFITSTQRRKYFDL